MVAMQMTYSINNRDMRRGTKKRCRFCSAVPLLRLHSFGPQIWEFLLSLVLFSTLRCGSLKLNASHEFKTQEAYMLLPRIPDFKTQSCAFVAAGSDERDRPALGTSLTLFHLCE
jgi:hypothetical protein